MFVNIIHIKYVTECAIFIYLYDQWITNFIYNKFSYHLFPKEIRLVALSPYLISTKWTSLLLCILLQNKTTFCPTASVTGFKMNLISDSLFTRAKKPNNSFCNIASSGIDLQVSNRKTSKDDYKGLNQEHQLLEEAIE